MLRLDIDASRRRRQQLFERIHTDEIVKRTDIREKKENTVFVGNIPYEATERQLREFFEPCGSIVSINIPKDKATGSNRGIAFVVFKESE